MAKRQKSEAAKKSTNKKNKRKDGKQENNRNRLMVILYVGGLSERIAKIYKKHDITTCIKPNSTLRQALVHPRTKLINCETQTCMVYEIPCSKCNSTYTWETKRNLSIRLSEQKRDITQQEKKQFTRSTRKESTGQWVKQIGSDRSCE